MVTHTHTSQQQQSQLPPTNTPTLLPVQTRDDNLTLLVDNQNATNHGSDALDCTGVALRSAEEGLLCPVCVLTAVVGTQQGTLPTHSALAASLVV